MDALPLAVAARLALARLAAARGRAWDALRLAERALALARSRWSPGHPLVRAPAPRRARPRTIPEAGPLPRRFSEPNLTPRAPAQCAEAAFVAVRCLVAYHGSAGAAQACPPPPTLVLSGHAASLPPY